VKAETGAEVEQEGGVRRSKRHRNQRQVG
jgi:hypothetical protein